LINLKKFMKMFKKIKYFKSLILLYFYKFFLKENDIVIDCGANVGEFIDKINKKGVKIYAFEPHPLAFKKLTEKYKNNNNIFLHKKGVYVKNDIVKFFNHKNFTNNTKWTVATSMIKEKTNIDKNNFFETEVIDFADFIKKLNKKIKIIKIDIEGVEFELLDYLIDNDVHKIVDVFFVETHERIPGMKIKYEDLKQKIKDKKIKNIKLNWI